MRLFQISFDRSIKVKLLCGVTQGYISVPESMTMHSFSYISIFLDFMLINTVVQSLIRKYSTQCIFAF